MGMNLKRENKSWTLDEVITNLNGTSTAQDFASSMGKIDEKLNEIKKEITYWDVYNISSAITSPEVFDSKIANLEINSSAVINTTYFKRNFQGIETEFHSGDVIIRLKDGSYQHIKAANAGVYVPQLTKEDEDQLTITYEYQTTVSEGDVKTATIKTLEGITSKMYGYSILGEDHCTIDTSFKFDVVYYEFDGNNRPITPVLKFFDANNQEVYTDEYTLQHDFDLDQYYFYLHNNSSGLIKKVVIK